MKHKKLFITLTAVLTVFVFFGIFILMWFFGDSYKDFKEFEKEIAIEGLSDGAIPQGIAVYHANYTDNDDLDAKGNPKTKEQQYFLVSAYMNDGSPSRIYVTGADTGYVGYVTMVDLEGNLHDGHVGGIATNGLKLWVTSGDSVMVAKASSEYSTLNILREIVDKAEKNSELAEGEEPYSIQFTASFKANCNAAFLFYYDDSRYTDVEYDRLYVGEFYRKGNYETDATHRLKTPAGYKNTALMYEYNIDKSPDNPYGLKRIVAANKNDPAITEENNVPLIQKIYSLPEKIQGIAFSGRTGYSTSDGILVLSQSYGLSNSHLLCFNWKLVNETSNRALFKQATGEDFIYDGVFKKIGDRQTPYIDNNLYVYYVDKGNKEMFVNDYSIPSMSEGMCVVTPSGPNSAAVGRIYVLFESAGKKYNKFTREKIKNVYSFIPHIH